VNAVAVASLTHAYGDRRALEDLSFALPTGTIFGLLGPNGGGKTTLFRILSTLMAPTAGTATVLGHDTVRDAAAVRRRIGVVFQAPSLDKKLRVRENLIYQGALYGLTRKEARARTAEMLARVGLSERAGDTVEDLSGGLKRRAELAKGLLHRPELLLLDEPSTGLDPGGRRDLWTYLERIRTDDGVTSLVTTHLMEEAEHCDRLAILDRGRLVALGTPAALKAEIGGDVVTLATREPEALAAGLREQFAIEAQAFDGRLRFEHADAAALVPRLAASFAGSIESVAVGKPTLEDVFIAKTGHRFWSEEAVA